MAKSASTQLLKAANLKITPIRLAVLEIIQKLKAPASAQEIQSASPSPLDYVSVYRTVKTLAAAGLIRPVNLGHGHVDYEFIGDHDHHHLICTNCKKMEEFDICLVKQISQTALKQCKNFATITDHSLELFGLCKKCQKIS